MRAMTAITKLLAGGAAIAALASAAPAAAQYYPGYGNPYGGYGGYGYGGYGYGGYGLNSQAVVSVCMNAVQARLMRYGYGGYGGGRVLGVSQISPRGDGGIHVKGVATSGSGAPDLRFDCRTDGRGLIRDLDINRTYGGYGYGNNPYDYSPYGYRRY